MSREIINGWEFFPSKFEDLWMYSCEHAESSGKNDCTDRLAGKATIASGWRPAKSEVLRTWDTACGNKTLCVGIELWTSYCLFVVVGFLSYWASVLIFPETSSHSPKLWMLIASSKFSSEQIINQQFKIRTDDLTLTKCTWYHALQKNRKQRETKKQCHLQISWWAEVHLHAKKVGKHPAGNCSTSSPGHP